MTKMTEMSSKLSTVSTMQTAKHGGVGLGPPTEKGYSFYIFLASTVCFNFKKYLIYLKANCKRLLFTMSQKIFYVKIRGNENFLVDWLKKLKNK